MKTRTKFFQGLQAQLEDGSYKYIEVDEQINEFLDKNPSIEVLDIKHSSSVSICEDCGNNGTEWYTTALVIYKMD